MNGVTCRKFDMARSLLERSTQPDTPLLHTSALVDHAACNPFVLFNVPCPLRLLSLILGHATLERTAVRVVALAGLSLVLGCSTSADEMTSTIVMGSSRIDVTFDAANWALPQPQLLRWVQNAAEAVNAYYGRYPRPHVRLRVLPAAGHGVRGGMTWGRDGGVIRIRVGTETTAAELAEDWMLTHEMVHLAFPSMPEQHHWIEEGMATYVEPIARIQAGQMSADGMWADLVRDMPKGQPLEGDQGLDHTHTWGRTYWGGALFLFVADIQIRKKTNNRRGLQDALRSVLEKGGDITEEWPIENALTAADQAVGVSVLLPLYQEWNAKPVYVDLSALWSDLGITTDRGALRFNEKAPLALIRQAITVLSPRTATSASSVVAGRRRRSSTDP
jgi:hypothetical protein